MNLESAISIRFPPAIKLRLTAIAERSGVSEAALVRMATDEFLTKVEAAKSITIKMTDELNDQPSSATDAGKNIENKVLSYFGKPGAAKKSPAKKVHPKARVVPPPAIPPGVP